MPDAPQLPTHDRRPLAATGLVVALALVAYTLLAAGCGGGGGSSTSGARRATPTTPAGAARTTMDDAGRAQQVPAAQRIDAGGDVDLKPMVLAAGDVIERRFPGQHVTWESSAYGRDIWGLCLGSSEVAAVRGRAGWGWGYEQCEKTGIRIISLPLARGVWLAVGSRASMRPEVAAYVDATLALARSSAVEAGVQPLDVAALTSSRVHYRAFVASERAKGTEPMVG